LEEFEPNFSGATGKAKIFYCNMLCFACRADNRQPASLRIIPHPVFSLDQNAARWVLTPKFLLHDYRSPIADR
jgi:hypothetical protein